MRARGRKFGVKTRPQIFLAQNLIFFNGSTAFRFPRNPRKSSSTAFRFLQQLSTFFNGFLLSSTAFRFPRTPRKYSTTVFRFLQRLSDFFNGFLLSSTAFRFSSTAFHFLRNPGKSIYGGKYTKDRYPSFVFPTQNRHIPR